MDPIRVDNGEETLTYRSSTWSPSVPQLDDMMKHGNIVSHEEALH